MHDLSKAKISELKNFRGKFSLDIDLAKLRNRNQKQGGHMARYEKTITVVHCAKLNRELEALPRRPFPGELGERIYNEISHQAWEMWQQQSTILINHYGLNMADPRANEFLFEQMEEFFFGAGAQMPEDWTPPAAAAPREK